MGFEQFPTRRVMSVVCIDVCVQRPRVDDQRDRPASDAMISSIRSEISDLPLRPAAAAPSCRRLPEPTCSSIAVRVSAETVMPRRRAS